MRSFSPTDDATASISVTTTTAASALKKAGDGAFQVRIFNAGPSTAFIAFGDSAVEAAVTDYPVPAGAIEVVTMQNPDKAQITHAAAITAASTATVYLTTGDGI